MKEDEPLAKVTIALYAEDIDRLRTMYPKIGYSRAIRLLVRRHIRTTDERINQKIGDIPDVSIDPDA